MGLWPRRGREETGLLTALGELWLPRRDGPIRCERQAGEEDGRTGGRALTLTPGQGVGWGWFIEGFGWGRHGQGGVRRWCQQCSGYIQWEGSGGRAPATRPGWTRHSSPSATSAECCWGVGTRFLGEEWLALPCVQLCSGVSWRRGDRPQGRGGQPVGVG